MNSGDVLTVDMHDTADGFQVAINDLTSGAVGLDDGERGERVRADPLRADRATCNEAPYAFHPMYATSSEHTRVPWAAHTYNVAFSDEIGHFEYCNQADENGNCLNNDEGLDDDDYGCFNADDSLLVAIGGCLGTDVDFDGTAYGLNWPGTGRNRGQDQKYHTTPVTFTSPTFNGQNFSRAAFETDLPRIEAADFGGSCDRITGDRLHQPAAGRRLLPDLLDRGVGDGPQRPLRVAARRPEHPGHHEHVRRELDRRVRAAALQLLPRPEPSDASEDEQLPPDAQLQPLPGVAERDLANVGGRLFGGALRLPSANGSRRRSSGRAA